MHDTPQRSYGGQSAEARRERRRGLLLDAAIAAMAAGEWRAATVEKLCAAAGLNKRYFYESFAGLDEVGAAVVDDIADEVRESTSVALAGAPADDVAAQAAAVVDALVRALVADPRRARVLLGGVASSSVLHQHRSAVIRDLTGILMAHARTIHDVELERDPLAQVAPAFLIGGTADAILAFVDGRAKVSIDDLISSLTALWLITGNGAAEVARLRLSD
ncbi:TetR/AcrR family transcriptional regulator [Mycobacterium sp. ITM-2016-00317]|uniref:TetR/AcrR family transcriptional regulator n=1 Tax=Mycobacterium sp. ITM-2016-00317 TaxID=2099694 RepID=UPI000D42A609|nr:TetR/AcrR family transcriptional regulator [Mycobacterium sp. ITM-2016-00317]WNG88457.1 TetR/AcrR family transcriptional regulator [Mycobacterium sp. ITM-2016-00317]